MRFTNTGHDAFGSALKCNAIGWNDEISVRAQVAQVGQVGVALFVDCPLAPAAAQARKITTSATVLLTDMAD